MTKQWGGRRQGSGPPRRRFTLSKEGGHSMNVLAKRWREARNNPEISEEAVLEELIQIALYQDVPPATEEGSK